MSQALKHLVRPARRRPVLGSWIGVAVLALWATGCGGGGTEDGVVRIAAGPEAQRQALEAFIGAQPGDVIEFAAGRFELDTTLSLDAAGVVVRGQGMEETVLDFSSQAAGSGGEGILVTADDFTVENLGVFNTRSDGIKVEGTTGATFRNVFVNWEGPPKTENGAYGLYPVQVTDVLIDGCKVRGSSDAGIYVGQSSNIIVRDSEAWENVAGIEIENSTGADVYGNRAWGNTGGILVFSLPELPVKAGSGARIFENEIWDNNHPNFGAPGQIVSEIPAGTGLIVMANDRTEVRDNVIRDHKTINLTVLSFSTLGRAYDDPDYDPVPEGLWIHGNRLENGGYEPEGDFAELIGPLVGEPLPDIVYDGVIVEERLVDGVLPEEYRIYVENNGDATFVDLDLGSMMAGESPTVVTDATAYAGSLPTPPAPIQMERARETAASGAGGAGS